MTRQTATPSVENIYRAIENTAVDAMNEDDLEGIADAAEVELRALIDQHAAMLAALEALFQEYLVVHRFWGDGDNTKAANAATAAARAAIAAVRGES